ncbi:MAG: phosphoribosylglycinamide formyltransferase [Pseudomonadota bacterium]
MADPARIAVLLSGTGSNLDAIVEHQKHTDAYRVTQVISDNPAAGGLMRAAARGIATTALPSLADMPRAAHDQAVQAVLLELDVDLVVLAGYMRILSAEFVRTFHGRMLNVHPSLLPRYRGLHTYRRALENGDLWHGTSVHFVTEELDGGPVIGQSRIPIHADDTETTLRARTQREEHRLYPLCVAAVSRGRIGVAGDARATLDGAPLDLPLDPAALANLEAPICPV